MRTLSRAFRRQSLIKTAPALRDRIPGALRGHATLGGFSLIEALIALLVLSVGLLGLAQFQARSLLAASQGKTRTSALHLAHEQLERLRFQAASPAGYAEMIATGGGTDRPPLQAGDNAVLTRAWELVASHDDPRYAEIRVSVTWTGADGQSASATLASYLAPATTAP